MNKPFFDDYLKAVTHTLGDPTYSVLKAHLMFEEALRSYLDRTLPFPDGLKGARLSFAQLLAVARSCSNRADDWSWVAIAKLNKLRNTLAHERTSDRLSSEVAEYIDFVVKGIGVELPKGRNASDALANVGREVPMYLDVDMATAGLYAYFHGRLGIPVSKRVYA